MSVRRARVDDLPSLLRLELVFPGDRITARRFRQMLPRTLIAARGDHVLGYAIVWTHRGRHSARIYSIAVDPSLRRQGVGVALVRAAEDVAREAGHRAIHLEVRQDNQGAIHLYEGLGYVAFGIVDGFYDDGTAAIRMQRPLD